MLRALTAAYQKLDECLVGDGTVFPHEIVIYLQKFFRAVDVTQACQGRLELP